MELFTETDPVSQILEGLNEQQKEAVTFETGPLLIIAGAGTGKTNVITRRIAYLITKHLAEPDEILALTYTEKAAAEMEDRVDKLVPYGYAPVWISTFHAFGDKILRRHALELGLPLHFDVLDELQQKIFLLENLWQMPLSHFRPIGDPTSFLEEMCKFVSRAKDEEITPDEYLAYCNETTFEDPEEKIRHFELANFYRDYLHLMRSKGFLDFGDQVALTVHMFRAHPKVREEYRKQFKYILVDEFQDTNYVQFQLLQLLANHERNITVVGDDDQSIYRFRGASLSNIMQFTDIYPDCHKVVLTQNYRSGQRILDAAYELIKHNNPNRLEYKHGLDKQLVGRNDPDSILIHRRYATLDTEADEVAKEIKRLLQEENYKLSDIAILVRKNVIAEPYLEALRYHGLPYSFAAHQRFFRRPEILWLISFTHALTDPQDSVHLFNLLSSPFYNFPAVDLALLGGEARTSKRSLYQVIRTRDRLPTGGSLSEIAEKTLRKLLKELSHYGEKAKTLKAGEVLYDFLEASGYLKRLVDNEIPESEDVARNLSRFFNYIRAFSRAARRDDISAFADHLQRLNDLGEESYFFDIDPNENKIRVMTVHKAKGLEFDVVFLPGLIQGNFPGRERRDAIDLPVELIKEAAAVFQIHDYRQEERRLFYVGMTRAKDRLYLTSAEDYGTVQRRKVSQFIAEALELGKKDIEVISSDPISAIRLSAPPADPIIQVNLEPLRSDHTLDLSFNQVDDLQTCALKYKISHVLRVPMRATHHLVFGRALHKGIETMLKMKKDGMLLFFEPVLESYERAWTSEGFLSREHEEMKKEEGRRYLKNFYDRELISTTIPFLIEAEFSFSMNNVRIRGRWDRVDVDGERAIIIDYKSSDVQEQETANDRARKNMQLYIYAMAFEKRYGFYPEAMELHFIDSGLAGRVEFKPEEVQNVTQAILRAADQIRRREFPPKPDYQTCRFCQVRQICSFSKY